MADKQKKDVPELEPSNTSYAVPRRAQRLPVPAVYLRYIKLKVKIDRVFVSVVLQNFSGVGILFESKVPFELQSHVDCVISISRALSREVAFDVRVKHCEKKNNTFLIGAEIEKAADETWLNVFRAVHDFILQRQDDIY